MEKIKKYKYKYKGTSGINVMGQEAHAVGDVIEIPIKNFVHKLFKSVDGGKSFPESVLKLKGKHKNKKCLLVGRGESSEKFDYNKYTRNYDVVIAVNPRVDLIHDISPFYVVYLENNYATYINRNIYYFLNSKVIGNDLALNCEHVDYHYGRKELIEGSSSGFYALQIAQLMGLKTIDLIGYDYYGKEYPEEIFNKWIKDFSALNLKGVKQLNKKSKLVINKD